MRDGDVSPRELPACIGVLIPEFPAQTHTFFERERHALARLGVRAAFVSTSPPRQLAPHAWAEAARRETAYLLPWRLRSLFWMARGSWGAGFPGWANALRQLRRSESSGGLRGVLRMVAAVVLGAELAGLARERGWQHVHVHSCADSANVALFGSILGGFGYSLTLHGALSDYGSNQAAKFSHARFAICVSNYVLETVQRALKPHQLPPRIAVASMGVDLERFTRRVPYAPWEPGGPLRLFTCGRLNPRKAPNVAIDALALLRERGIDARLALAGGDPDGRYLAELRATVRARELEPYVEFLGPVSEEGVRTQLERAHVYVHVALEEAIGVALMEAMAMSLPVVATRVSGIPELVIDAETGWLVPPRDAAAAADAIAKLAGAPEDARRLGAAGRARIETHFTSAVSARALVASLREDSAARGAA